MRASVRLRPLLSFFRGSFTIKCTKPFASAIERIGTISSGISEPVTEDTFLPLWVTLTEMVGQTSLVEAKRDNKADWERNEAFFISCHPRTPANLVTVIIFCGSFLEKLIIPWYVANFHESVTLIPMSVVVNRNHGSLVSYFFSNAKLACLA